ncbi:hypothetical protein BTN50_1035 [Candidatus Enterovibrio altilux]|uniref:Uncharacterized protein n=2 Tax=Candidatus Enterovibrio altilux TaxID=1927128 RepID=A0A291B945_9GAMM|nr:hypothetical protein BTN50_1035 [Candidatus Enterovibrio luxaltus]
MINEYNPMLKSLAGFNIDYHAINDYNSLSSLRGGEDCPTSC